MTESQVSKSTSSVSQQSRDYVELAKGKMKLLDRVFPLMDQMMQHTKLPSWILSIVAIFMLCQLTFVGFWIYTPQFSRTTGGWTKLYQTLVEIFMFQDATDFTVHNIVGMPVIICIAGFSILWIIFMIYMNSTRYSIQVPYLYISSLILDIIDPILIVPAVYIACHGITGLSIGYDGFFVIEIIVGLMAVTMLMAIFLLTTFLKCRSVVLTNLTFPLFDHVAVTSWAFIAAYTSLSMALIRFSTIGSISSLSPSTFSLLSSSHIV